MADPTPDPVDQLTTDPAERAAARAVPHPGWCEADDIDPCDSSACPRYRLDIARLVLDAIAPQREEWGVLEADASDLFGKGSRESVERLAVRYAHLRPVIKVHKVRDVSLLMAEDPWRDPEPADHEETKA